MTTSGRPIVWTIASSDCSGGAGIQADIITMNRLGAYGASIVTGITVQNTRKFSHVEPVPLHVIAEQFDTLTEDMPPVVIKTGLFGSAEALELISTKLKHRDVRIVCDPVLKATLGSPLIETRTRQDLLHTLLPKTYFVTPNTEEAAILTGINISSNDDMVRAADALIVLGAKNVLLKGGHRGGTHSIDYWTNGKKSAWLSSPRNPTTHSHGTGCTLSAAIASLLAQGYSELDSIIIGKAYINQGLRLAGGIGQGRGPLYHGDWPANHEDLPVLLDTPDQSVHPAFPRLDIPTPDVYPIVDRADWINRLASNGVTIIQLRAKDLSGQAREAEAKKAIEVGKRLGVRVIINDDWEIALQLGAYGVHLGQDDLPGADFDALHRAGLRLGISTHNAEEIARAKRFQPSYVAIGTLYHSPSKSFKHSSLGLEKFSRLRRLCPSPVVAIGGITLEKAPGVFQAGADIVAVISDITSSRDPEKQMRSWREFLPKRN
jgi:hydroxymethylpyrimidine kinase/phosphomethylpyrimidine kinase/thiamine-phosphate diphosphorylase